MSTVDAKVDGDVVAVMGNVELGPSAEIGGDVVAVMGGVERDPAAVVHGSVQRIIDSMSAAPRASVVEHLDHSLFAVGPPLGLHCRDSAGPGRWRSASWSFMPALR